MEQVAKKGGRLTPLQGKAGFRAVYGKGKKDVCRYVVVYARANKLGFNRYGTVASKKIGGAVVRNKARRRVKEILRQNFKKPDGQFHHITGFDIIVVARPAIAGSDFSLLAAGITSAMSRLFPGTVK